MRDLIEKFIEDEDGQAMVEYALIIALITVVALVSFRLVVGRVNNIYYNGITPEIANALT